MISNILITGGCGFIGVNLISHILDKTRECKIRVVDNLSSGKKEDLSAVYEITEISGKGTSGPPANRMELVVGDIRDGSLAVDACRGMDAVVHLAANTGVIPSIEDPRTDCMSNVIGTFNYLEAARKNNIKKLVFASSGAPLGEQVPPIHEEMVPKPISPYGASKLCGEAYCSAYYGSFGLEAVALRFGNVYGPRSKHKGSVVAKFIKHILASEPLPIYGDGNQTRDFIYVGDLVEAIILAMEKPRIGGEAFQIATHLEHTVSEVAEELNRLAEKHLGRKSLIVYEKERRGEVRRNFSDISKARRMLGFEPEYDLRRGLEETFLWFLRNQRK
ncbi:MAG: NAD-dependent epimerase/dehydratase family protein [Deltaproteobacteria bacterium]|nr:NAD-dependent epimerase/dehydratase family protein [Deltaproteobacteria bacterium]